MFNNIGAVMPLIQGGKLRALGVTSSKRAAELPDVPTVSEAGVPGFDVSAWYALFVPARTPPAVIQKLHADTVLALADPATKARLEQLGVGVIGSSPEELRALSEGRDGQVGRHHQGGRNQGRMTRNVRRARIRQEWPSGQAETGPL